MLKEGDVFSLSTDSGEDNYLVIKKLDKMCRENSGCICVNLDVLMEKGLDGITTFDLWRVTDKYLEMQIQRGKITIIKQ